MKYFRLMIAVFLIISLFPVHFVEAHSSLVRNSPQGGEKLIESPKTIELWFNDPVIIHSSSIKVMGSSGNDIPMKDISYAPNDKAHVMGKLEKALPAGTYMVEVNVLALDGDAVTEKFTFEMMEHKQNEVVDPLLLVNQYPSDGEIIKGELDQIELWFNQPAEITAIGLFNERSFKLQGAIKDPDDPNHIVVKIDEPLPKGTYQVTWYGHPDTQKAIVQRDRIDVFYFAIDEFAPLKEKPLDTPIAPSSFLSNFGWKQVGYWFFFVGTTLLFGVSFFIRIIVKKKPNDFTKWLKVSWGLFFLTLIGFLFMVVEQKQLLSGIPLSEFITIKFIFFPTIQLVIIVLGLLIRKIELVALTIALILVPFSMGHASYPRYGGYFTMGINVLHVISASIWLGGLLALLIFGKRKEFSEWLQQVGGTFSKWAFSSLIVIIVSGLIMTYQYIPTFTWESFYESNWGKAILFKSILTILIVMVGYTQRNILKNVTHSMLSKFKRRGISELLYGSFAIFFASILLITTPSAAEQGIYSENPSQSDAVIRVEPFKPGVNTMTFEFPADYDVEEVSVQISMPPQYQVDYQAFKLDDHQFAITGNLFHAAGTLYMEVNTTLSNGEEKVSQYSIVVPGERRFNE
jgi:copper transport protein